jgi:hypothetical protein
LVYEFRIQQFDLIETVETNATKRLFKGVKNNVTASFREVFALKQRVDFVMSIAKSSLREVIARSSK